MQVSDIQADLEHGLNLKIAASYGDATGSSAPNNRLSFGLVFMIYHYNFVNNLGFRILLPCLCAQV